MAKLALLLATSALFLLAANASIYRTTIVIDGEEVLGRQSQESCQQQIQQQQRLSHCQIHLRQQVRGGGQQEKEEEEEQGEEERGGSGRYYNQQQTEVLRQCCRQLQQLDASCRCQGLQQIPRLQQQQGQIQGSRQVQQAYETASEIPRMCKISPREGCQFGTPRYVF